MEGKIMQNDEAHRKLISSIIAKIQDLDERRKLAEFNAVNLERGGTQFDRTQFLEDCDIKARFTREELDELETLGWEFVPTGPNEWEWLKFGTSGGVVARQGGAAWTEDTRFMEVP